MLGNIRQSIGNTPLLDFSRLSAGTGARLLAKHEARNPAGSVKCRVAVNMIEEALKSGSISTESVIIEPTSGNTGIGLAFACASLGIRLILTMPESMSIERRKLLSHLGAEIVLTEGAKGMKGAIAKAEELAATIDKSFIPDQFGNPANPAVHYRTTGPEIWADTEGQVDIFVAGVGTGGTISGAGGYLKEKNPHLQLIAVEPAKSPVISGGSPAPHKIQGIGAGFIPKNLNTSIIDQVLQVEDEDAIAMAQEIALKEGVLCGISCGAAVWAAIKLMKQADNAGKTIVTVLPDTGERYLSTDLFA